MSTSHIQLLEYKPYARTKMLQLNSTSSSNLISSFVPKQILSLKPKNSTPAYVHRLENKPKQRSVSTVTTLELKKKCEKSNTVTNLVPKEKFHLAMHFSSPPREKRPGSPTSSGYDTDYHAEFENADFDRDDSYNSGYAPSGRFCDVCYGTATKEAKNVGTQLPSPNKGPWATHDVTYHFDHDENHGYEPMFGGMEHQRFSLFF